MSTLHGKARRILQTLDQLKHSALSEIDEPLHDGLVITARSQAIAPAESLDV